MNTCALCEKDIPIIYGKHFIDTGTGYAATVECDQPIDQMKFLSPTEQEND